jgi:3D (Asp-Asp-Asp) domain-containing protein
MPNKCGFDKLHEWMADPRNMLVFFVAVLVLVIAYLGFLFLAVEQAAQTITPNTAVVLQNSLRPSETPSRGVAVRVYIVTGYTSNYGSTGKHPGHPAYGITKYGHKLTRADAYRAVAADPAYYPAGTKIHLEGVGVVTVVDTGSDIKGPYRLDLYLHDDDVAWEWGRQKIVGAVVR